MGGILVSSMGGVGSGAKGAGPGELGSEAMLLSASPSEPWNWAGGAMTRAGAGGGLALPCSKHSTLA